VPEPEPQELIRHEVNRQLDLVAAVGYRTSDARMSIRVAATARKRVLALLQGVGLHPDRPWAVVHPGATAASRRYPPELFAAAARRLVLDVGIQVVFTGSEAEGTLIEDIRGRMGVPSLSLAGRLDIEGLAALIAAAPILIANNTGPLHLASSVGTAVVALYALTNPQHTPWRVPHRLLHHDVPCKYCYRSICPEGHHDCLRKVPPEAVVEAVCSLLTEPGRRRTTPADLGPSAMDALATGVAG
jgi:ADP-heptose:LPS heptosyltransferase